MLTPEEKQKIEAGFWRDFGDVSSGLIESIANKMSDTCSAMGVILTLATARSLAVNQNSPELIQGPLPPPPASSLQDRRALQEAAEKTASPRGIREEVCN